MTFETFDFNLAIFFYLCKDFELVDIKKITNKKVAFVFNDPHNKKGELEAGYWEKKIEFPVKEVLEARRELKARLMLILQNKN